MSASQESEKREELLSESDRIYTAALDAGKSPEDAAAEAEAVLPEK
ncbi:hypothetical protein [Actinomadura citrea]|nr:hypothetical protein [Actinomadura citrea]GGU08496.1 hypothetical protein GCM10010177_79520 [Actinomadura citrea]